MLRTRTVSLEARRSAEFLASLGIRTRTASGTASATSTSFGGLSSGSSSGGALAWTPHPTASRPASARRADPRHQP